jgi:hypothetical protein
VSLKVGLFFGCVKDLSGLEGFGFGALGEFQRGDFINKVENNFHGGQVFGSVFVGTVKNDSKMAITVREHFLVSIMDEHEEALCLGDSIDGR